MNRPVSRVSSSVGLRAVATWFFAVSVFLGSWLTPTTASADGNADEADLHFVIGAELYAKDDFRGALEHFLLSNRLVPNKNVIYNIARTFEKLAARSGPDTATRYYSDAYRYYVDALVGEADETTKAELERSLERIAPNVSVLRVTTEPAGATIYIDRKDLGSRGRTPLPLALPPGKYKVIVERDGYETAVIEGVEAKRGAETKVAAALKAILGTVKVDVQGAPGAQVHVADEAAKPVCTAPCQFDLTPGTHLLYFTRPGFQAVPRQVTVARNETVSTIARLAPLSGSLYVDADERGARVEVDGKFGGLTPALVQNVAVGKRKVTVTLRGFAPIESTVDVQPNQQADLVGLRLEPLRQVQAVSRLIESIEDAPSSLSIIEGQELRAFGYPTIAEALRGTRGFYLQNDRAYISAGVRGIGEPNDYGNRVLILADGAVLNDNLLNSSFIGSDGRNDLGDVERIEIVRGPGSLLYGTGAFSGVVNLVPRYRDNESSVFVSGGTYDNRVARARAGFHYNFTKDAGAWASASASRSDGFELPIDVTSTGVATPVDGVDRFAAVGTQGSIWWKDLSAQWFYHKKEQRIPVGAFGTALGDNRTHYRDERFLGEVRYEPRFNEYVQLFLRAHANHYAFDGLFITPSPDKPLLEKLYGTWFGGEARVVIDPIKQLRIVAGGEVQHHPFTALRGAELEDDLETPVEGGQYLSSENSFTFGAPYALVESSPIDWFRVSAGVRFDIYTTFGAIAVPRGALIFKPMKGSVLKLMGGRAFRAPSVYEQFYSDGGFSQVPATDPDRGLSIGPESVVSGEIEYSHRFLEDWVALAAAHSSYVENIINTVPDTPGSDIVRYANSDVPALTVGGEIEIRREWRQGWMLSGFYGYQRAQYLDPTDAALQANPRLVNAPEHLAGAKAVVPVVQELASIGARATLEAPRRIGLDSNAVTDTAAVLDLTLSGYANRFGLRYVIGVYNLFDWQYQVPVADTYASRTSRQNGRTFLAEITLTYPPP